MVNKIRHRHGYLGKYQSMTPNGKIVFKNRPIHNNLAVIDKHKRKVFTGLAKQPYEVGGQLDFEQGDLDNAKVHFGNKYELEFPWNPDYETSFHSHPSFEDSSVMPSYEDILSMQQTNEKEQVIFHETIALSIFEKEKFQHLPKKTIKKVSDQLQEDYEDGFTDKELYAKYKPIFKNQLGLLMTWHPAGKDIKLKSKSV
jgi:hypothetical protein